MKYKNKGFSLIELIAVIAILTIAYAIIFQIFTTQTRIYSNEMVKNDVQNSGRVCLNSISNSIIADSNYPDRMPGINPNDTPEAFTGSNFETKLKVLSVTEGDYWYVLDKGNNQFCKITASGNKNIIANNVEDVNVEDVTIPENSMNKIYKINVTIRKGDYTKDFTTEASLRNEEGL